MGSAKRLSIIIVNWKVRELLRECLLSLFRNTALPKEQYEVVVVDNDSGDGSVAMIHAEFPEVTAIANSENVGFGAANNQAMHYCSGTSILLLNPDTVVLPGAVDCMLKIMETSPQIAILGCRLQNGDGSLQRWTGGRISDDLEPGKPLFFHRSPAALGIAPASTLFGSRRHAGRLRWLGVGRVHAAAPSCGRRADFQPAFFHVRRGYGAMPPSSPGGP